jgi:hypothetical protein
MFVHYKNQVMDIVAQKISFLHMPISQSPASLPVMYQSMGSSLWSCAEIRCPRSYPGCGLTWWSVFGAHWKSDPLQDGHRGRT